MADFNKPTITSLKADFPSEIREADISIARMFDGTTDSNIPTSSKRLQSRTLSNWNGSSWDTLGYLFDTEVTLDTDGTLSADSDSRLPSQKAIKSYTDNIATSIPTDNSQLSNGAGYATVGQLPTNNNQLTNGAGFQTAAEVLALIGSNKPAAPNQRTKGKISIPNGQALNLNLTATGIAKNSNYAEIMVFAHSNSNPANQIIVSGLKYPGLDDWELAGNAAHGNGQAAEDADNVRVNFNIDGNLRIRVVRIDDNNLRVRFTQNTHNNEMSISALVKIWEY